MSTPEYERWTALTVRQPADVHTAQGGPVPLLWQMEKRTAHHDRVRNTELPADFPHEVARGDAEDALAVLALDTALRQDLDLLRVNGLRDALRLGATWREAATALDLDPDEARGLLREWAEGQHRLYQDDIAAGRRAFGLDAEAYAAELALTQRGNDERGPRG